MQVKKLKPHIDKILPNEKWNFDLEGSDKILRIDSEENIGLVIIDFLNIHNHTCEELECKKQQGRLKNINNYQIQKYGASLTGVNSWTKSQSNEPK